MMKPINRWLEIALLLIVYSLVYFFYTKSYPWLFSSELPGTLNGDISAFLWNTHHFEEWIHGRQNYFSTDLLFAPYGTSLYHHTYSHLLNAISYLVGNTFLGINLVIWLHYIFSGLGAYLLSRFFKLNWKWAFIVGFVFAFIPYKFAHYNGHYNLQQTAFIPFFILYFFKVFPIDTSNKIWSGVTWQKIIPLGILGILCLLSSYIYASFLFLFCVAYFLYYYLNKILPKKKHQFYFLFISSVLASLVIPHLQKLGIDDQGGLWWRDDLMKFLTPNWNNKFYHNNTPSFYKFYHLFKLKHNDCFMGYLLLLLTASVPVLYLFKKNKLVLPGILGFMALFFFMLSSPEIYFLQFRIGNFPTAFYHFIPTLNNLRIPERFIVLFALFLSIYVFSVWQNFLVNRNQVTQLIPFLVIFILFIEYQQNDIEKAQKNDIPSWAIELKKKPKGHLLPLPTGINDGMIANGSFDNKHQYLQSIHKHKLIGGYVARFTPELRNKFLTNKVFKKILALSENKNDSTLLTKSDMNQFIKNYKVNYLLVHDTSKNFHHFIKNYFVESISDSIHTGAHSIYTVQ